MSKLNEIVPPLELCKQIPDGEFADSVLGHHRYRIKNGKEHYEVIQRGNTHSLTDVQHPAPTLQEILEDLTKLCVTPEICYANKNYWQAHCETLDDDGIFNYHLRSSTTPATAALRLWLKLKGIEA